MKKFLIVLSFLLILASPCLAVTIEGMTLFGGNGPGSGWSWNGQGWNTVNDGWWVLGVSSQPNGILLNQGDTTITGLPEGTYWLYAAKTGLGTHPRLDALLSDATTLSAIFELSGPEGTENSWTRASGSDLLFLGWAQGTADKVGGGQSMVPDTFDDFYLKAQVGSSPCSPAPIPGALWLLGSGLLGLAGLRQFKKS